MQLLGKNGVTVDSVAHEPGGDPVPLHSQAFVQIGTEVSFYFLLPKNLDDMFNPPLKRK